MAFEGDRDSEEVLRLFGLLFTLQIHSQQECSLLNIVNPHSSDSSRVLLPSDLASLLSSRALLSISSSYAASRLFMVARRFVFREPADWRDFPSLFLDLSRFDEEEEDSGEEVSRTGRYCEDRGL